MSGCCHHDTCFDGASSAYRRTLMTVIAINAVMFAIELGAGIAGQSMALQADALDFLSDTATYGLSLWVIGRPLMVRARAALFKGASLGLLGAWVLGSTLYRMFVTGEPDPVVMGTIGMLAFAANVASALLLLRFRNGDANVRSVWLCSRNDAIGNLLVVLAATGVFASASAWPDLIVAFAMASLFLHSALKILRQALKESAMAAVPVPAGD